MRFRTRWAPIGRHCFPHKDIRTVLNQGPHIRLTLRSITPLTPTFNYFARTHGIPAHPTEAVRLLLSAEPTPVQVACIHDRVLLVNASLGLYPDLLEDREAYKARFGRSRWVAFLAACATLLRAQRRLRLHIESGGIARTAGP